MQDAEFTIKGTKCLLRANHLAVVRRILATSGNAVKDKERNRNVIWWSIIMVCLFITTGRSRKGLKHMNKQAKWKELIQ